MVQLGQCAEELAALCEEASDSADALPVLGRMRRLALPSDGLSPAALRSHAAAVNSVLLDGEQPSSALRFLDRSTHPDRVRVSSLQDARRELLVLMREYLARVGVLAGEYTGVVVDMCMRVLAREHLDSIRQAALTVVELVVNDDELSGQDDGPGASVSEVDSAAVVRQLFSAYTTGKARSGAKARMLAVLGAISRRHPAAMEVTADNLVETCLAVLRKGFSPRTRSPDLPLMAGALCCMCRLLHSFSSLVPAGSTRAAEMFE